MITGILLVKGSPTASAPGRYLPCAIVSLEVSTRRFYRIDRWYPSRCLTTPAYVAALVLYPGHKWFDLASNVGAMQILKSRYQKVHGGKCLKGKRRPLGRNIQTRFGQFAISRSQSSHSKSRTKGQSGTWEGAFRDALNSSRPWARALLPRAVSSGRADIPARF